MCESMVHWSSNILTYIVSYLENVTEYIGDKCRTSREWREINKKPETKILDLKNQSNILGLLKNNHNKHAWRRWRYY